MGSSRYKSGSHTKHRLIFHIVFRPKYRKRILRYELRERLIGLIKECCVINEWVIHSLEVMEDHVHMLIQINPDDSVSSVMQKIKGGTSKVIREEYPEIKEFLWGGKFWSEGYFAETAGKTSEKAIRRYIEDQNKQQKRDHGL